MNGRQFFMFRTAVLLLTRLRTQNCGGMNRSCGREQMSRTGRTINSDDATPRNVTLKGRKQEGLAPAARLLLAHMVQPFQLCATSYRWGF